MDGSLVQSMHLEKKVWQWTCSAEANSGMLLARSWFNENGETTRISFPMERIKEKRRKVIWNSSQLGVLPLCWIQTLLKLLQPSDGVVPGHEWRCVTRAQGFSCCIIPTATDLIGRQMLWVLQAVLLAEKERKPCFGVPREFTFPVGFMAASLKGAGAKEAFGAAGASQVAGGLLRWMQGTGKSLRLTSASPYRFYMHQLYIYISNSIIHRVE